MAQCKLCLQERKLCNSHIVPDFIFRELKKQDGSFYFFRAPGDGDQGEWKQFYQTLSEKLLCSDCESLLSRWEGYASRMFANNTSWTATHLGERIYIIRGADYAMLKLFFMSLLWRFAVSSSPWFKRIDLGPHTERLRKLIIASSPGEPWRYGCMMVAVTLKQKRVHDVIIPAFERRFAGVRCVTLVIGGILLNFFVCSHVPPEDSEKLVTQENGEFFFFRMEVHELDFMRPLISSMKSTPRTVPLE